MRKWIASLLGAALFAVAAPAFSQEVPEAELEAAYGPAYPGTGIKVSAILGAYVKSITPSGSTLTVVFQNADSEQDTFDFTAGGGGASDGVLTGATFDASTQTLTLQLSVGSDITVDLSDLTTLDEVNTRITSATADFITLDAVSDWAEEGNTDDIPGSKLGQAPKDGVVSGATVADHVLTLQRTESLDSIPVDLPFEVRRPNSDGSLPTCTLDEVGTLLAIDHQNIRVASRVVGTATTLVVDYENYAAAGFRGVVNNLGQVSNPQNGDIAFQTTVRHFWRYDSSCACWGSQNSTPTNWRGAYSNETQADNHVTAVGDLVWWTGRPTIARVSTYTQPGDDTFVCGWAPSQEIQELIARPELPAPSTSNAGQFARVNAAGDSYETAPVMGGGGTTDGVVTGGSVSGDTLTLVRSIGADVTITGIPDDVIGIPSDDVTQIGGGVNHIQFLNTSTPQDGTIYHWISETTTTGSVEIRIGTGDYTVFKAGETVGSFEQLAGGEFENSIPQQVTFQGGTLYWTGTLLGTAAGEDVGTDAGELVRLNAGGKFNPEQLGTNPPNDQNWLRGDGQWAGFPVLVEANPGGTGNADLRSIGISGTNYDIIDVAANPGGQGNSEITSITINDVNYDVSIGDAQPAALRHEINRIAALERITSQLSITRENEGTPTTVTGPIIARTTTLPTVAEAQALAYANEITHADSDTHRFYVVRLAFDDDADDYTMVLTEGDGGTQTFPVRTFSEIPQLSEFAYYALELHFPFRVQGTVTVQQQTVDSYDTRYKGEVNEELARQLAEAFNYRGDHTLEVRQTFTSGHYLGNDEPAQAIFRHGTEVYLAHFDDRRIQVNRETIREGDFSDVTTMMRNESHWIYPQGNQMHFVRIDDHSDVTSITYPQGALVANGTYEVRKIIPAGTSRMLVLFYAAGSTPPFLDLKMYEYTTTQITTVAGTPTLNAGVINTLVGDTYEDFTDSQIQSIDWDLGANIAWFMVNDATHTGTALPGTLFLGTNMANFTNGALVLAPNVDFFAGFSNHVIDFYARIVGGTLNRIQILSDTGFSTLYEDVGSPQIFVENINSGASLENQVIKSDGATSAEWGFTGACIDITISGQDIECEKDDGSSVARQLPGVVSDDTLNGEGTTASPLGVDTHDVITRLTEDIRYYTDPPYQVSDRGSTVGHRFTTSDHRKVIYRVGFHIDPPGGNEDYRAHVYALAANGSIAEVLGSSNTITLHGSTQVFNFDFPGDGVNVPGGERVDIVVSRTNNGNNSRADVVWGDEASGSPDESYDDADQDFDDQGFVEYRNANPAVGESPEGTGTSIHGNPHIHYRVIYDRGSIVTDLDIPSLPNLASTLIADHDDLVLYDVSDTETKRITFGELAARLADGTTITSNAGTLSAVGGGGGTGDNTLAVLTESLNGDGTADLGLVTPVAGDAANQDFMLIWDRSMAGLRRTGLGDLAGQISANPFQGTTFYTADVAPGDPVLMRDISLGINHSLSLEHLYGQMFTIAGLHQTAPANDDQIVIRDVSSNILRHVRWDQFNQGGGGGGTTVVANPAGTDGTDLTRIAIGGTNYNIAGGSGGGGGDSVTELFSGTQQLTTNLQLLGAGIEAPTTGHVRVYVEGAGNREGAVGSARIPAARLLAAQKAINASWSADDANQRTIPIGANRSLSVATNEDAGDNHILIAAQDTAGSGDFQIVVEHVVPGAGGGGGGGIRIEEGGTERIASADALNFDTDDFDIGIIQSPEAAISIAPGGIDENQLDIGDNPNTAEVLGWDGTGMVWRSPSIEVQHNGTEINSAAAFINFIGGTVANEVLGVNVTLPAGGGGGGDPFDGITTVTATPATNDLLLFRDVSESTNRAKTFTGFLDDFNELLPSNTIDTGDYIFFTNISNTNSPTHKISATDFMTAFPRLITAPLFTAPATADEFIIFDVSDSNAVKRLSVSNVRETVGRVNVEKNNAEVVGDARTIDFGTDILVTADGTEEVDVTLSQNVARIDDVPGQEEVDDYVNNLLVAGANITLSYNDDANTMTITGQAGGGGGTTVVANPGYVETNDDLGSITIGSTDYNIRHPHRGFFDNTIDFQQGDIVETGSGAVSQFWIAREDISAGLGEPNEGEHGMWWHVAGNDGNFRGTLDLNTQYDVYPGDYWIVGGQFYIATEAVISEPGSVLTRTGHDHVDQLVHSLRWRNDGAILTEDTQEINFTGAGVTCTEPTTDNIECNIPGGETDTNNYVTGGAVSGTTLTLTRQGLGDVTIAGLPSGGEGGAPGPSVEILAPMSLSDGESVTEVTLTVDVSAGNLWSVITQTTADTVESVAYFLTGDLLAFPETYSDATPPTETSPGGLSVQIPTPNNTGFRHDSFKVWRSDEANKIWVKHSGRNEAMTLRMRQQPFGGSDLTVLDEGSVVQTDVRQIDFEGTGVTCSAGSEDGNVDCSITGGGTVDFTNITTDVLPSADNSGNVGTTARTWGSGQFTNMTINNRIDIPAAGNIHLADAATLAMGSSDDARFAYSNVINHALFDLRSDAIAFSISDNANQLRHTFNRDGSANVSGQLTVASLRVGADTLREETDDNVNALLQAGDNVTLTYSDAANTLTIASEGFEVSAIRSQAGTPNSIPQAADRIFLTDESQSGDPLEYITTGQLFNAARDVVTANNSSPATNDRVYLTDESVTGDPLEYATVAQLSESVRESANLDDACVDLSYTGTTLTCSQADGGSDTTTIPIPSVRTRIFTPSDTAGVWALPINLTALQVTVDDIDDYEYITISLWAGIDDAPMFYHTITVLRSDIKVESNPDINDMTPSIRISSSTQLYVGRDSAGTTLYFRAQNGDTDTGKVVGIWGGDF